MHNENVDNRYTTNNIPIPCVNQTRRLLGNKQWINEQWVGGAWRVCWIGVLPRTCHHDYRPPPYIHRSNNIMCTNMAYLIHSTIIMWYIVYSDHGSIYIMVYVCILWYTMLHYCILCHTVVYYGIILYTMAYCDIIWYTMHIACCVLLCLFNTCTVHLHYYHIIYSQIKLATNTCNMF